MLRLPFVKFRAFFPKIFEPAFCAAAMAIVKSGARINAQTPVLRVARLAPAAFRQTAQIPVFIGILHRTRIKTV